MGNVGNIRCHTYGCNPFKRKGGNLRFFWSVVGGIIGFILLSNIIGCNVCEICGNACTDACVQSGASCGNACETCTESTNNCSTQCTESCDKTFTCEGVTCGDRVGCFSCNGFGDCSSCGGRVEYTVRIFLPDGTQVHEYTFSESGLEAQEGFEPFYGQNIDQTYYEFLGYYNKKGTKLYADSEGKLVKPLSGSTDLYAKYQERAEGEEYALAFNTSKGEYGSGLWFEAPAAIPAIVGDTVTDLPQAPWLDGYTFLGWYNMDGELVVGPDATEFDFHLYLFNHNPENSLKTVTLYAKYSLNQHTVTFNFRDGSIESRTVDHGTMLYSIWGEFDRSQGNTLFKFFGWSNYKMPVEGEVVTSSIYGGNTPIEDNMQLYEVRRDWIDITFHFNDDYNTTQSYRYYEGQECLFKDLRYEGSNLNEYMKQDGVKPGYEFVGWGAGSALGTTVTYTNIGKYDNHDFYAQWSGVTYRIEYYDEGRLQPPPVGETTSYRYGYGATLWNYGAAVYDEEHFLGWRIEGRDDTIYRELPTDMYGNLKLIAVFSN